MNSNDDGLEVNITNAKLPARLVITRAEVIARSCTSSSSDGGDGGGGRVDGGKEGWKRADCVSDLLLMLLMFWVLINDSRLGWLRMVL